MLYDSLCQTFYNSTFSYAGLTDKNRVILLAAAQYLCYAFYFFLSAYYGIQQSAGSSQCQVGSEVVKNRCLAVGRFFLYLNNRECTGVVALSCFHVIIFIFVIIIIHRIVHPFACFSFFL